MKQILFFIFSFFIFHLSFSQVVSRATELIVAKKYAETNCYLDSVLKKDKDNVDALMMKGNVILNRALENLPPVNEITQNDESIFYSSIQEKNTIILPVDTVRAIEKFWTKCLEIDSNRIDILKGLCTIYSMALMKGSLEKTIVRLKKTEPDDGEQAFRICEYARKFKERNRFNEAMQVYQFIAQQFPDVAGVRCDIASEYFYEGELKNALVWLDSTYNFKTVDETSFLNGAFIYSELFHFDDAQNVLNTYSKIYERKMDVFYYALRLFSDTSDKYFETLTEFLQSVDTNSYSNETYLAHKLLACRDSFSIATYRQLVADNEIPDFYKVLIHARAIKQFTNDCEPFLMCGVYQSSVRNYSATVQFLEEIENCNLNSPQKEYYTLHYAYALLMTGEKEKSLNFFSQLFEAKNSFSQQAAKYFSAKILSEEGKKDEAKKLLEEIISSSEETKYVELAKQLK